MCGRFTITLTVGLGERFLVHLDRDPAPQYNIAPSETAPVIFFSAERGVRELRMMQWGLVPSWVKDPATSRRPINARAETLLTQPLFRSATLHRRCLVPATGFLEWRNEGRGKVPFYIRRKDGQLMAFAGLYEVRQCDSPEPLSTFTIVTTPPNPLVARYHDRMPAILLPGFEQRWIEPGSPGEEDLGEILTPYPEDLLIAYQVSGAVNAPQNKDPAVLTPAGDRKLPF
ncbi:putative SOS response-associated peptidase YedK [Methanolinea mesophila]|uniref:SOS response-associated peptidase n=1 Tax=Methanolinea mesophila TaxID=547055 RepID=UPI001AE23DF9|nr:SOS response-associated peptidase [Methanolinea mesophila]MBP1929589.1 putative SOS response-associated peptidase YedK [Methanolinea mesophila]